VWEQIDVESANLRVAWQWAAAEGAFDLLVRMSAGLNLYWELGGLFEEAATMYREAVRAGEARRADQPLAPAMQEHLVHLRIGESYWLIQRGVYGEADRVVQDPAVVAAASTSPNLLPELAYCQGELAAHQLHWIEARPRLEQAVKAARAVGRWDVEVRSSDRLAQAMAVSGELETAVELLERALALRQEQNDRVGVGQSLTYLCMVRPLLGNYEGARDAGEQAVRWNRLVGARASEVIALAYLGDVLSMTGRFTEAERCQRDAVRLSRETGWRLYYPRCLIDLSRVERLEGDFASAQVHLEQALVLCREIGGNSFAARVQVELSRLAHWQGHYQQAFRKAEEALAVVGPIGEQRQRHAALVAMGHAELSLGRLPAAAATYQAALLVARTWRASGPVIEARSGLAQAALLDGDLSQAQAHLAHYVSDLLAGALAQVDDPAEVYLTAHEILQGLNDPRADRVLAAGYELLEQRAAGMMQEARRSQFLEAIPSNRTLVQAWRARRVAS
jgi:tetratricopeptide (TPR) repeat protein